MDGTRFLIFSCGYNCEPYVEKNIISVERQTYRNYRHVVIDDASTDGTWKKIQKHNNINLIPIRNDRNKKWIRNALIHLPENVRARNDVVVILDLDDWLIDENVLEILNKAYMSNNYWMIYSRMMYLSGRTSHWIPTYTKDIIENKKFRNTIWSYTHLRSFRYFLWENINENYLTGPDGEFAKYAWDRFVFMPMLEMSSPDHIGFIPDVLYVYNDKNPFQVEKSKRKEQEALASYVNTKRKYRSLVRNG